MPNAKNSKKNGQYRLLDRRERVAALYLQGKSQQAIARLVGVSQATVSGDLAAVRKDWLASTLRDFDLKQAEELAKLDRLELVAWEAWERSCRDVQIRRSRAELPSPQKRGRGQPRPAPRTVVEETRKGQAGDPRFLERVAWCVETRLKLLGLLKPGQVQVGQVVTLDWDALAGPRVEAPDPFAERIARAGLPPPNPDGPPSPQKNPEGG